MSTQEKMLWTDSNMVINHISELMKNHQWTENKFTRYVRLVKDKLQKTFGNRKFYSFPVTPIIDHGGSLTDAALAMPYCLYCHNIHA